LPDGRFVESDRFRIGKGGFRSFGRSSQIKYCPLGRLSSLVMKTKCRRKFIEPAGKQRFDRFGGKVMKLLAPSEKHRVVGDIMRDGVLENIFAFFQPCRF